MGEVLDVYQRPINPCHILVCFDETPMQLVSETRKALPMKVKKTERWDYEYQRKRTANPFMFYAPFHNWRHVEVTAHRTLDNWTMCMNDLVYLHFPQAERCVLVEGSLNTHDPSALYEVFPPAELKAF